jgi:hypothetical protein
MNATPEIELPDNGYDYEPFVCYECKDGFHDHCIGVPCMCGCPIPPFSRANPIALEPEYYI